MQDRINEHDQDIKLAPMQTTVRACPWCAVSRQREGHRTDLSKISPFRHETGPLKKKKKNSRRANTPDLETAYRSLNN